MIDMKDQNGNPKQVSVLKSEIEQELIARCGKENAEQIMFRGGFTTVCTAADFQHIIRQLNSGWTCKELEEFYLY